MSGHLHAAICLPPDTSLGAIHGQAVYSGWDTIEPEQTSLRSPRPAVKGLRINGAESAGSKTTWMAIIYPFRAWRYNSSTVRLADVVTQPCDTISPALQQAYYQRSPYNLVRIILGLPELFDADHGESVYTRATSDFHTWRRQGVLMQESLPCVYGYAQRFTVPGTGIQKERLGFVALGKLHEDNEQVAYFLEGSNSQPEIDRLNLLRATHAQFGSVLMLYSDPARSMENLLADGRTAPEAEVTDDTGVSHQLWRISERATIRLLITAMADKKLILAEGRQGYETALQFARECARTPSAPAEHSTHQLPQPARPESAMMMTFVNMDTDGLLILPSHRVLYGLSGFSTEVLRRSVEDGFDVVPLPVDSPESSMAALRAEPGAALVAVTPSASWLLRVRKDVVEAKLSHLPAHQRNLDLVQLHALILGKILGPDAGTGSLESHLRTTHEATDAIHQVKSGEADIAFLTNPVTVEQLKEVAFAGGGMPKDSIDFYPRLLNGLTIYALD